jgi:hypothetical protein
MEQETSDELNRVHSGLLDLFGCTILVCKSYPAIFEGDQTMIGYGDPMGVGAEIFKYAFGTSNWLLKVDDPLFRIKAID